MTSHSTGIIVCGHYLECLAYLAGNVAGQPVQAFIQSLTSCSTGALNVPVSKIKVVDKSSAVLCQAEVQKYNTDDRFYYQ